MKNKVTVKDDSHLLANCAYITPAIRQTLAAQGMAVPLTTTLLPNRTKDGKMIMEPYVVNKVYEGAGLANAIKRAKRWIRNKGFNPSTGIPNHINLAMAAFNLADKPGFDLAMEGAAT